MNKNLKSILIFAIFAVTFWGGKKWYMTPRFAEGEDLPAFTDVTADGAELDLKDLRGNLVLLDFWGSWCGPCRAKNPDLVRIYDRYHGREFAEFKDFEIVSVGIDRNEIAWQKAIQRDKLHWKNHILDTTGSLKFFDGPVAKEFGVKEVPSNYLLNAEGRIIGVNLRMQELADILENALTLRK